MSTTRCSYLLTMLSSTSICVALPSDSFQVCKRNGRLYFHIVFNLGEFTNRPEYISAAIQTWAAEWVIKLEYIQPGNPQQNAYVERFNRTIRYEWLSQYYWSSLEEVQEFATRWMWSSNNDRPNMALG